MSGSGRTAVFADQDVGFETVKYLLEQHPADLRQVVTMSENEISALARRHGCPTLTCDAVTSENARDLFGDADFIVLAWWPRIIPAHIINAPRIGVVNFHPSLLPYNRGKHYNFWTLVEDTPFGVSLHFVNEGVDSGDVIFQAPIQKTWEDTGETLYTRAKDGILALFKARYVDLMEGRFTRTPQDLTQGGVRYARELEPASRIDLEQTYRARDLLNLLRARTFEGKPACYFDDAGERYEVRISVKKVVDERQ